MQRFTPLWAALLLFVTALSPLAAAPGLTQRVSGGGTATDGLGGYAGFRIDVGETRTGKIDGSFKLSYYDVDGDYTAIDGRTLTLNASDTTATIGGPALITTGTSVVRGEFSVDVTEGGAGVGSLTVSYTASGGGATLPVFTVETGSITVH